MVAVQGNILTEAACAGSWHTTHLNRLEGRAVGSVERLVRAVACKTKTQRRRREEEEGGNEPRQWGVWCACVRRWCAPASRGDAVSRTQREVLAQAARAEALGLAWCNRKLLRALLRATDKSVEEVQRRRRRGGPVGRAATPARAAGAAMRRRDAPSCQSASSSFRQPGRGSRWSHPRGTCTAQTSRLQGSGQEFRAGEERWRRIEQHRRFRAKLGRSSDRALRHHCKHIRSTLTVPGCACGREWGGK